MLLPCSFFGNNEYIFASNNTCSINLNVGNNSVYSFLVDTGATICALKLRSALKLDIPIHRKELIINGIGGQKCAIGYVYLQLHYQSHMFEHKFYIFDDLPCQYDGIIGQDFLVQYHAIINLCDKNLTLTSNSTRSIKLPLQVNKKYFTLPPRSESIHYVTTDAHDDCVIGSKELQDGVFLAGSLVSPINGNIPLRILNTTETEIQLNNISICVQKASDYDICSFESPDILNVDRLKELFNCLKLGKLNLEEQKSLENLCAKFSDIFFLPGDRLTTTNIYKHNIIVKPNTVPLYTKPYRLPHAHKDIIQNELDNMLKQGIIEKCSSEWSSPLLLVPKKNDGTNKKKWRVVIDYRKLNNCIQDDKFPLPNITEILDSLSGCVYFTHLDLANGYYQCELDTNSRQYTAFASGEYRMTRMPQGLRTSPNSFSRMMNIALSGLTYDKCLVYLDDLIVFGKNLENHNRNLMEVFQRLRKVNLKLNPQKCEFLKKELLYLGHVVSNEGVLPDPEKIIAIKEFPVPTNSEEVKRFVAFANYYRKFIERFAEIVMPLNYLSKKNVSFIWNDQCQVSFETLKEKISSPPVLQYPNFSEDNTFILQTDASGYALGAVLSNGDNRPVAFASRTLNKAEKNYPTIQKELLSIVWAIKHFRPYLYGTSFIIRTDHKPLIYLFGMRDPSSRLLKFRLALEEYDFKIEYIKGSDNGPADALSRVHMTSQELKSLNENIYVTTRAQLKKTNATTTLQDLNFPLKNRQELPKETHTEVPTSVELKFISKIELDRYRTEENKYNNNYENKIFLYDRTKNIIFIKFLDSSSQISPGEFVKELDEFCTKVKVNTIYIIKNKIIETFIQKLMNEIMKPDYRITVKICILSDVIQIDDRDQRKIILNDFHLLPTSGHAGMRRMYNNVKKYYFWPGMESEIRKFVKRCEKCQKNKYSTPIKEPMVITTTATYGFEKVFLDLCGPLQNDDDGYSYILTLQCELTKFVEAYPLFSKRSEEVAKSLVNNFILRYGVPRQIASDRGTEFLSSIFKEVSTLLDIEQLNSTAYHHQSIGALENTHKHLAAFLRIQTDKHPETWSSWLPFWCFSFNTSVHTETNYTPFELVYGRKCKLPSNLSGDIVQPLYNHESYPKELKYRLQLSQKEARDNLLKSKTKRKTKYDLKMNIVKYKANDKILLKNELGNKLNSVYLGPYKVLNDVSPNVEVEIDGKTVLVHKNRTKPYYE